jgi:hypothetical protein
VGEEGARRVIVIKYNRYARPAACSICDGDHYLNLGLGLFEEGSWQGICDDCAREHAPGMLALLKCVAAQRAYWEVEQERADAESRRKAGETLASLEEELDLLQERLDATQARIEEMRLGDR